MDSAQKKVLYNCQFCNKTNVTSYADYDQNKVVKCSFCNAIIRYNNIEIEIEGSNSNEVKMVAEGMLKNVADATPSKSRALTKHIMGFFSKKVKCKRFYESQSRTLDITGLNTGIQSKFNFGLGSFKLDNKYQEASEQLMMLDLLQYGLCNDINGISDPDQKNKLLQKIIDTKTKMLEIVLDLNNKANPTNNGSHFNYLTKSDLVNLLLNFNSAAFTTPFRLEESLINFQNRILSVSDLFADKLPDIHPDFKRFAIDIFALLKVLRNLSQSLGQQTWFIPWESKFMVIDVLRYALINQVNTLLSALYAPDIINSDRFLRESYLVTEAEYHEIGNRIEVVKTEGTKVRSLLIEQNLDPTILDNYITQLFKFMQSSKT